MAINQEKCISTKKSITNDGGAVKFLCPNCGKYTIIRSQHARKIAAKYICPECSFEGPN